MKRTVPNSPAFRAGYALLAAGATSAAVLSLAVPSALAANVQIAGLTSNGQTITCSDTVRTQVRTTLSGSLARIENAAETSDAAAERAIGQLDAVITRATVLARSAKYSGKAQAQCVLAFLAESCNISKDRIAGSDALSDAVGDSLSDGPTGGTTATTSTSTNGATTVTNGSTTTTTTATATTTTVNTSFELSKTGAAIGETVPFTYSVSTDRTCEIYVVSSQRKLLANIPAGTSGSSSYKTVSSEAPNGVIVLEMACTNGSRKSRSITIQNASTTSTSTSTTSSTNNTTSNGSTTTAATNGSTTSSTTTTRAIQGPDQWMCTGDGANQMLCSINQQVSCPSSPPYTPRSWRRYTAQTPQCSTGIGEGCMCIYNISTGIWTASTTINEALLTSETAPMVHLDPIGNGSVVKVIDYSIPAGSSDNTMREYHNRYKAEMETYAQANGIRVTGQIKALSKYVACTPGARETHYNIGSQYDIGSRNGKVYLYTHDFLCVGATYLVRWLNEIEVNVAARTVTVRKGKMYFQDMALLDPDGANAPQIQLSGGTYKTIHLTGKQCTLSFTDGSSSEAAVNNGAIPQKFLTGIDGGKAVQLLCSTTGTEKMAYMSKYNNKYHFVNIVHFQ